MPVETLVVIAALSQPSGQTTIKGWHIGGYVQHDTGSWAVDCLKELDALLCDAEIPSILRPTYYSYSNARKKVVETSALLREKPELTLDGEGGIDIEWQNDGRLLMYACRATPSKGDYIYFQFGNEYGGKDYSPIYSTDRLNWLLKG